MDLDRYRAARARNGIAKQILDVQEKLVLQDEGTVKNDQGTVQYDQVQVDFCHITAPIGGRVGLRLVDPGNVVQPAGTATLAVITQLEPITVIFTIPEDSLGQVQARLSEGAKLPVDAFDRTAQKKIATRRRHLRPLGYSCRALKPSGQCPNADHSVPCLFTTHSWGG
jgi:multidrug efflux system membrane fusion protein